MTAINKDFAGKGKNLSNGGGERRFFIFLHRL
jgi:hypothetical protein